MKENLPRINFDATFRKSIQDGKKTLTLRLSSDIQADINSDLGEIFQHSLVWATSQNTPNQEQIISATSFALLRISHKESKAFHEIDDALAKKEGMRCAAEIKEVLHRFYPDISNLSTFLSIEFECVARVDFPTLHDTRDHH